MYLLWLLLIPLLAGVAFFMLKQRGDADIHHSSSDHYLPHEAIPPAHAKLLLYLQVAFSGQVVLFRPALAQLVSVRNAADREKTQAMLERLTVDFVVCNNDGKPLYAFDVRPRNTEAENAKARRISQVKTRVLKAIDVRLIRIQRSVSQMPPVGEFAMRLRQSLDGIPAGTVPLSNASAPPATPSHEPPPTDMAALTEIMSLPPDTEVVAPPPPPSPHHRR